MLFKEKKKSAIKSCACRIVGATNTGGSGGTDIPWETEASIPKQRGPSRQIPRCRPFALAWKNKV